jgi:two-component system, chemotaxis family, protein-glutamate methylesterase/glutaminase
VIGDHQPDVVVLDIEMPEMDGLTALAEIRREWPRLPVIMYSAVTERGAAATLDALARGATDYATKPTNTGSQAASAEHVRAELVPKLRQLGPLGERVSATPTRSGVGAGAPARSGPVASRTTPSTPFSASKPAPRTTTSTSVPARQTSSTAQPRTRTTTGPLNRVDVVAIGVSTGGPNALAALVAALPASFPVPILIVQHMPPLFTRLLAERLDKGGALAVHEARNGDVLQPGAISLAPGDHHMVVQRIGDAVKVLLNQKPPEHSCRPAVDPLFRSVASAYGSNALGVVLTGMGSDGSKGAEAIVQAGGRVLAQDEETSIVWGMPGFIARAGIADDVLPLPEIAAELIRRAAIHRVASLPARSALGGGR